MGLFTRVFQLFTLHTFAVLSVGLLFALLVLSVYRLYFHPLAKFPGRKLAALTVWYEYYHDAIRRGQYTFEIKQMHEKYGQFGLSLGNVPPLYPPIRKRNR